MYVTLKLVFLLVHFISALSFVIMFLCVVAPFSTKAKRGEKTMRFLIEIGLVLMLLVTFARGQEEFPDEFDYYDGDEFSYYEDPDHHTEQSKSSCRVQPKMTSIFF